MYTSVQFGKELKERLLKKEHVINIGNWAYSIYLDHDVDSPNLNDILLTLSMMADDPDFVFSNSNLNKIADDLILGKVVDIDSEEYVEPNPGALTKEPRKLSDPIEISIRNNKIKTFGNKEEFAISYISYLDEYPNDKDILNNPHDYIEGGNVYFWVKNKNLFAFKDWGDEATYGYPSLCALIGFLSAYLVDHLTETPFPIKTRSKNGLDMVEEFFKNETKNYFNLNQDNIDVNLRKKVEDWHQCRSFSYNRGGSFLPQMYIRRVADQIEISWHNTYAHDNGKNKFDMLHIKGVDYIDANLYREVVTQFCFAYIEAIKDKNPEAAELYRKNLRKAVRVPI